MKAPLCQMNLDFLIEKRFIEIYLYFFLCILKYTCNPVNIYFMKNCSIAALEFHLCLWIQLDERLRIEEYWEKEKFEKLRCKRAVIYLCSRQMKGIEKQTPTSAWRNLLATGGRTEYREQTDDKVCWGGSRNPGLGVPGLASETRDSEQTWHPRRRTFMALTSLAEATTSLFYFIFGHCRS